MKPREIDAKKKPRFRYPKDLLCEFCDKDYCPMNGYEKKGFRRGWNACLKALAASPVEGREG